MPAGRTYDAIASVTLSANTSNVVVMDNIPSTYTDLILVAQGTNTTSAQNINLRFNNDSNSLYSRTAVYGDGTSALSTRDSSQTSISLFYWGTGQAVGIAHIMNYANATNKTVISRNSDAASSVNAIASLYRSTSAITSITLIAGTSNLASGSTFTLYGVRAA